MDNRPRSREKRVTQASSGVHRRGSGLNTGPVGKRKSSSSGGGGARTVGTRAGMPLILVILFMLLGGGSGGLSSLFGGDSGVLPSSPNNPSNPPAQTVTIPVANAPQAIDASTSVADTTVAKGARAKYTKILGNNKDKTTIMVYMCGTDLESKSGMATSDLSEMAKAGSSDNINLIIYTGGCQRWHIDGISNSVNQVYQIVDGKLIRLVDNAGAKPMTDPATLTEFISFCKKNYPANRYDLIFWDHGGGSVKGYGYDQNYTRSGSMTLAKIDQALKNSGIKFDFIGFDACLMATAENAIMLSEYADYMVASEETEPGIGWYYTDWLKAYVNNPSMDTLSIGKNIVDSFVDECGRKVNGQPATLSVIDLAEFEKTVPSKLKEWSIATSEMIQNDEYQVISKARHNAREFAQAKYDQCDFVDLMKKMDTKESNALADALCNAIKYNRTTRNMSNAYGVSIYFPNRQLNNVTTATQINNAIGIDEEFSSCLKEYASLQIAGQSVAQGTGNTGSPLESLFGTLSGTTSSSNAQTQEILENLFYSGLNAILGGRDIDRAMSMDDTAAYITAHQFDSSNLVWMPKNGNTVITLSEEQWSLVTELELNMFYDDGYGYIDLGYDNLFDFDNEGSLIAETDNTWLAINGQPVAYYHTSTVDYGDDDYTITGVVPAYLNGERVDLLLVFDSENPYGYIAGTISHYENDETDTMAKIDGQLKDGDVLDFVCDFYDYNGNYENSYYLGEPLVVKGELEISNVPVGRGAMITYKFTDIYQQEYWTPVIK